MRASHAAPDSVRYCDDMRNVFRNSVEKITEDVDEDTIELMLNPEQMRLLSKAAAAHNAAAADNAAVAHDAAAVDNAAPAESAAPPAPLADAAPVISNKRASSEAAQARPRPWPAGGVAAIVGVTVVLGTLVALGAIAQRTSERRHLAAAALPAPTPVETAPPTVASSPPTPAEPVRVKNPFDHSEVFEFPPGTSPAEARQAVADLLMERARDRHVQFVERKHGALRRASARAGSGSVGADLAQNSARMPR